MKAWPAPTCHDNERDDGCVLCIAKRIGRLTVAAPYEPPPWPDPDPHALKLDPRRIIERWRSGVPKTKESSQPKPGWSIAYRDVSWIPGAGRFVSKDRPWRSFDRWWSRQRYVNPSHSDQSVMQALADHLEWSETQDQLADLMQRAPHVTTPSDGWVGLGPAFRQIWESLIRGGRARLAEFG